MPIILVAMAFLLSGCEREQGAKIPHLQGVDLTGEWALEWEDRESAYKETVYLWITQSGEKLAGNALDPNLIPADVSGAIQLGEVTFDLSPSRGIGFRPPAPPVSTFKGGVTGTNSMAGRYSVQRLRGPWKATRTASGTNRTVSVSADTKLVIPVTSDEYDRLLSLRPPLSPEDAQLKEGRRVADFYEVEKTIGGNIGSWLYEYRLLADFIRINPATHSPDRLLQEKILRALNERGYPWKSIPR